MAVDFRDAAERHWDDAGYLLEDTRLANADQLLGLFAECALKAVMLSLGMELSPRGVPAEEQQKVHINRLWNEFIIFANNRNGMHYTARMPNENPFADWNIGQRYQHRSGITRDVVNKHQTAAMTVKTIIDEAVLNGEIK